VNREERFEERGASKKKMRKQLLRVGASAVVTDFAEGGVGESIAGNSNKEGGLKWEREWGKKVQKRGYLLKGAGTGSL